MDLHLLKETWKAVRRVIVIQEKNMAWSFEFDFNVYLDYRKWHSYHWQSPILLTCKEVIEVIDSCSYTLDWIFRSYQAWACPSRMIFFHLESPKHSTTYIRPPMKTSHIYFFVICWCWPCVSWTSRMSHSPVGFCVDFPFGGSGRFL